MTSHATVKSTQKHNAITFAHSSLFHSSTCLGQLLWPSSGRDKFKYKRKTLQGRHRLFHPTMCWSGNFEEAHIFSILLHVSIAIFLLYLHFSSAWFWSKWLSKTCSQMEYIWTYRVLCFVWFWPLITLHNGMMLPKNSDKYFHCQASCWINCNKILYWRPLYKFVEGHICLSICLWCSIHTQSVGHLFLKIRYGRLNNQPH